MGDCITTIVSCPNNSKTTIIDYPVNITVNQAGVQGTVGPPGAAADVTGAVVSLNNLSAIVNLTGAGSNYITVNGQIITISGEALPVNLSGYITSGQVSGFYYPINNPSGFITGFNSGIYLDKITNQTVSGLKDFTSGIAVSYISGDNNYIGLIDSGNNISVDWSNRVLKSIANNNIIDWGNLILNDTSSTNSMLFGARVLIDGNNKYSIEYNNRYLRDSNQIISVDYNHRILSGYWNLSGNTLNYRNFLNSGIETQFINYPFILSNRPTSIISLFENQMDNYIYNISISGVNTTGFYANFSDLLSTSGYMLDITINI